MDLSKLDLEHIWHPCSQMKDYEDFSPIVIKEGNGIYIEDTNGKKYIDAISSWWVNIFGHSNKRLNNSVKKQLDNIEHVIFANFTHKPAIELCEKLAKLTPGKLNKFFFASDGSSAVEIALKMAFQAQLLKGNKKRNKFIGLSGGYHGESIGAMSSVGVNKYNKKFTPLLFESLVAKAPNCYKCNQDRKSCNVACFESMEEIIKNNYEEVAAVIFEPICQGAAGMNIYNPKYLSKLEKLCNKYDIYMIADEIAMGFGRTGKMFASEHGNIKPDFMVMSKGLTAGYLPMSLVSTTDDIYSYFYDDFETEKAFLHSHSYSGNPLACAVALENLKIFEEDEVIKTNIEKSKIMKELLNEKFSNNPYVGEVRSIGMIFAIELAEDKETKKSFDPKRRIGYKIYKIAVENGLLMRPMGDVLYFMPPYIITIDQFKEILDIAEKSINTFFK